MKRALPILLSVIMLFSLFPVANAAVSEEHEMVLAGTSGNLYGDVDGITFDMQIKAPAVGSTASIIIKFDAEKLEFVTPNANTPNAVSITSTVGLATLTHPAGWGDLYASKAGWVTSVAFLGGTTADGKTTYLAIQPEFAGANLPTHKDALTSATSFRLAFKSGVTVDDIDSSSIKVLTVEEVTSINQSEAAVITDGAGTEYNYNPTVVSGKENNLKEPTITLNGKPLPAGVVKLTDLTLTSTATTATVPTGNTAATIAAPTVTPNTGADASGVTFKLYTDSACTAEASKTGVTVNASTGVVSVAKTASTSLSDGANKFYLQASKNDVKSNALELTITKAAAVPTTVTLNPTSGTATLKAAGGADAIAVGVTVKDQYGNTVTGQTPSISGQPTGVSYTGGQLTFDNTARATTGVQNITFTVGGQTATFALTIKKGTQAAPTTPAGVKTTTVGGRDGKITGVTAAMEYSSNNGTSYTPCGGTEVTGLAKGAYKVRFAATDYLEASPAKDVTIGEPGKTDTPTVAISSVPAAVDGTVTVAEDGSATLTATVTPATGTIHYQWKKGTEDVGTDAATLTVAAADADTYTCVVTREASGESVSDPATSNAITVKVRSKISVTVTNKPAQTDFKTGAISDILLTDIATVDPADAASKLSATIVAYEKVVTPGTPGKDSVPCNCSQSAEDPTTAIHDEGCAYEPAVPPTPDTVAYNPVTTLEAGKDYFLGYSIAALTDDTYSYAGVAAPSAPTVEADEANFVKVTTRASSTGGGGISNTITVRYNVGENGTLTGSATETVKRGEYPANVPTVTAKDGFRFLGWSQNGKDIVDPTTVKINGNTTFTALYAPVKNTYISGYPDGTFRPDAQVTRAEVASMLARLSKDFDSTETYVGSANDVAGSTWFANFVNFGMQKGIISGYTDGSFRPDANITRGEFASMLARYMGLSGTGSATFADTTGHWAADSIAVLADKGIVTGYPDGGFHPDAQLTRAEAVQMINTALAVKALTGAAEVTPSDVASTHWAYTQIIAAMNTDIKDIVK